MRTSISSGSNRSSEILAPFGIAFARRAKAGSVSTVQSRRFRACSAGSLAPTGCSCPASISSAKAGASAGSTVAVAPSAPARQRRDSTRPVTGCWTSSNADSDASSERDDASDTACSHAEPEASCSSFGGASAGSCSWSGWLTRGPRETPLASQRTTRSEFWSVPCRKKAVMPRRVQASATGSW